MTFTTLFAKAGAIFRLRGLVIVALCLGLAGCEDWFKKEIPKPQNNWDELCAIKDCSQYPDGYFTLDADERIYYFPPSNKIPRLGIGNSNLKYIKRESLEPGAKVLKVYSKYIDLDIDIGFYLADATRRHLKEVGLIDAWPANTSMLGYYVIEIGSGKRGADAERFGFGAAFEAERLEGKLLNVGAFYILTKRLGSKFGDLRLLSNRPVLNGYHLMLICNEGCSVQTVRARSGQSGAGHHVSIDPIRVEGFDFRDCDFLDPKKTCPRAAGALEKIVAAAKVFEEMMKRLQVKPEDRKWGKP